MSARAAERRMSLTLNREIRKFADHVFLFVEKS